MPADTAQTNAADTAQANTSAGYSRRLIREHMLALLVNGIPRAQILCTPRNLPELVLGHLYCEEGLDPLLIRQITITEHGDAEVTTIPADPVPGGRQTCSPPNAAAGDFSPNPAERPTGGAAKTAPEKTSAPGGSRISPAHWEPAWIFALADRLAEGMPLHAATRSAHCCFLAQADRILFAAEDISRHCAADKAIGHMLLQDIPPEQCILYTSGRIPSDLVQKALRAGIPVLAGKAAPTAEAVKLAADRGLTLIGNARPDRMVLFHDGGDTSCLP